MFILNITSPFTLILLLFLIVLLIFLGRELKKSYILAIPLFAFLALLIMHVAQLMTLPIEYNSYSFTLSWCVVLDFAFIFISFISYLWIDDIESKADNKKSLDNSLDWFWKEV